MNQVDTDRVDVLVVLDKYYYCDDCLAKDELFEILDEVQSKLDEKTRQCNGLKYSRWSAVDERRRRKLPGFPMSTRRRYAVFLRRQSNFSGNTSGIRCIKFLP